VADLYAVLEMVANAEKPLVLLISDESLFPAVLDLLETVHGDVGTKPFVLPYLNPITPLAINEGTSDKLLDSVARGIPAIYSNYGMAGMTTPITCAGTLAFLNAELLAGLVLSQLARQGAPVILGSLPMFFEMRHVVDFYDPQSFLINVNTPTTLERYQTACYPGMFPRISLEKWQEDRPVADRVLRERARDLLEEAEPPEDHDAVLARGEAFIKAWETRGR
jgi:trimethylamine--corrinoid protein Co-methyltransferase